MNLFENFFISALFYNVISYSVVVCRISDKRKCADADCSEPISLATTLIRYNADDERLLSFPRNMKIRVFSKEAGDTPNFWEVEEEGPPNECRGGRKHFLDVIFGKRGYVPKGLLREDKVLVPSSKLTHIVSTGRSDTPKQNVTNKIMKEQETNSVNMLSATPELPVANSKGLFSTIGGVSADSVPMNSPDIKPQSTRKFQVFEGTTIYEDAVSEKPESPPIVIDDTVKENQESDKKLPIDPGLHQDSNLASSDIKPVTEIINEGEPIATEENSENNVENLSEIVQKGRNTKHVDEGNQLEEKTPESPGGSNLIKDIVNSVTSYITSGAGEEDITEELEEEGEEDEEGSAEEEEEEEHDNGKETSITDEPYKITIEKESREELQPEKETLKVSYTSTSDAPRLHNIFEDNSSNTKMNGNVKSEKHDISNQETVKVDVLAGKPAMSIENSAEKSRTSPNVVKTDIEEEIKVGKQDSLIITSEGKNETVTKVSEIDKVESESTQVSDLFRKQVVKLSQEESLKSDAVNIYDQPDKTKVLEKPMEDKTTEVDQTVVKETTPGPTDNQSSEPSESEAKSETDQPQVQEHSKTQESQKQEQTKTDESQFQEQPKTDEFHFQEQPKTDESQIQELPKSDESKVQEQLETTADIPSAEPTTRQFLFGMKQMNEVSPEQHSSETNESPTPPERHDDIKQVESLNDTTKVDSLPSSNLPYSSVPTLQSGSPKYTSYINRHFKSVESSSVNEIPSHSEEEESEPESDHINDTSDSTHEETISPDLLHQSQSPKYASVVSRQIGSLAPTDDVSSETTPEVASVVAPVVLESADFSTTEEKSTDIAEEEIIHQPNEEQNEEIYSNKETVMKSNEDTLQGSQTPLSSDAVSPADEDGEAATGTTSEEGMFSWVSSLYDVFGSRESINTGTVNESPEKSETLDASKLSHFAEETCSADGIEGSCHTLREGMQKEVTWQESSYTAEMWDLMERVPLEATIWLIITAVVVLIFSLGHYYIEAHRRDGPLVAVINRLEREVLILKKESCILEDRLQIAEQQLETWNTSSIENDALVVELKQELEELKIAKAELEDQAAQLKEELETVTESGLEMHRLLEESLSSQDGSQVLLSTVETLREKLQRQEDEISGLSHTLSSKDAEIEELQGKLVQSAEVARSLEDKVISVTREKEEEALQLRDKHRELISQLEEVMETKALDETRLTTEMSKLRLTIEELQKTLAEKDSELDTLKEVVKQLRATDSNEKMEALFDVVGVQAKLKTAVAESNDFREKFMEEEGARKLLEGHMKKITQEVADLKNSFETAEKEKIEALTKLQVLSNYFKEKESQLQKELGLQESMWLQKQSDDHSIYEQMRSLREENEKYKIAKGEVQANGGTPKPVQNLAEVKTKKKSNPKAGPLRQPQGLQNESLKKEIVEQEASFKIQLANTEQKAHENWVASRQAERRLKEAQQESAQLRNRLTLVEKNSANYSLDEKPNISESNGDPSSPPPSLMFPPTTSPPFMMYGPPIPPPGDFLPPPPLMGSPYPSDSRPPPLGRISSPPLDHRFSPPPPLSYPPYDYPPYGHHSPSPPPHMPPHHRNVHKPQPREMSREQKDHVPNYSPEAEKTSRRNKR